MPDEKDGNWIVSGLGGVNLVTIAGLIVAVVWAYAQGHFGQHQAREKLDLFEQSLNGISENFEDIENQIDALRQTNTAIAIIELNAENTASNVNRISGKVDSLQESQRDIHSEVREIQRLIDRLSKEGREVK